MIMMEEEKSTPVEETKAEAAEARAEDAAEPKKAKKAALQKILFDGIIGKADTRAPKIEPLCHGAYYDFKDFFDTFFISDGEFSNYAELIPNIPPVTTKISGGYKVLYKIIVKKDKLRSCLEKQGIIKSLSNVS